MRRQALPDARADRGPDEGPDQSAHEGPHARPDREADREAQGHATTNGGPEIDASADREAWTYKCPLCGEFTFTVTVEPGIRYIRADFECGCADPVSGVITDAGAGRQRSPADRRGATRLAPRPVLGDTAVWE